MAVRTEARRTVIAVAGVLVGLLAGLGLFTFWYARGASYLSNNPEGCRNCHVMNEAYASWLKSSHRKAAVCNDCHAPHDFFGKYTTKAINGWFHSVAFTTGRFPDRIIITPRNHRITEAACAACHSAITVGLRAMHSKSADGGCVRCHGQVGHAFR